jgi:hypothetical protein
LSHSANPFCIDIFEIESYKLFAWAGLKL